MEIFWTNLEGIGRLAYGDGCHQVEGVKCALEDFPLPEDGEEDEQISRY